MEKSKKPSCGCFSFLRRRVKQPADRSLIIETIHRRESIPDHPKDQNSSMDHSLITTQKLFSPANFFRSTIMPPCKTPQAHSIRPQFFINKDQNTTARVLNSENEIKDASLIDSSVEVCKNRDFTNEIKQGELFDQGFKEKSENKGRETALSPGFEFLGKSEVEKNLPILEISPIKSIVSVDDFSDIVNAFGEARIGNRVGVMDLFERNKVKARPLPILKASTPRYLGKQSVLPKLRKENQVLLENYVYK